MLRRRRQTARSPRAAIARWGLGLALIGSALIAMPTPGVADEPSESARRLVTDSAEAPTTSPAQPSASPRRLARAPLRVRLAAKPPVDSVLVRKRERRMHLLYRGQAVRSYQVSLGRNPVGHKLQEGDGRTPEGRYRLDWRNEQSAYYRSIHVSYPSSDDLRAARQRGVSAGGNIMIHGLPNGLDVIGRGHLGIDWTDGCIAVTNAEMDEILRLVDDGTPIEIRP